MKYFEKYLLVVMVLFASQTVNAEIIKKTASGICHPPESAYYNRVENFRPFDSVKTCLARGGRLPKTLAQNHSPPTIEASPSAYDRSAFGNGWSDSDGDCQNSRAEALIATSSTNVRFATERACRVVTGRWISPFTGRVIQNTSEIDIDHVVPLRWAWDRGASGWPEAKREDFANNMVNLWPVELSLNRSKGARGPDEWLPPAGQCGYVARFARVVRIYELQPLVQESTWMKRFLDECGR